MPVDQPDEGEITGLALRKALARFYPELASDPRAAGERFAPFENLAAHYLLLAARTP